MLPSSERPNYSTPNTTVTFHILAHDKVQSFTACGSQIVGEKWVDFKGLRCILAPRRMFKHRLSPATSQRAARDGASNQHDGSERPRAGGILRLKCDGSRAETRFGLSAKRTNPFKLVGASVQSTTGSRGVRIRGSNAGYTVLRCSLRVLAIARAERDGTRAETRFGLSAKRTNPIKLAGASVQSTTGSRGVRIRGSNAAYTMFRGSVKSPGYPLYSPVSPSLPLP